MSADDLTSLVTDVGPVPMNVGAVLIIDGVLDEPEVVARLERGARAVPRLRQRLQPAPFGGGRPVWVDDADFDVHRHVATVACGPPGDDDAVLDAAVGAVTEPLDRAHPLWRVRIVSEVAGGRTGLVVCFHHVLADGIGGLAILASLVDGAAEAAETDDGFPRPSPSRRDLVADANRARLRALRRVPAAMRRVRSARRLLPSVRGHGAARTSLNRRTGARRRLRAVHVDLERLRRAGDRHGATVNDVLLAAVAGALDDLLATRGEHVEEFVVSVPVSARRHADTHELGNAVGVVPVSLTAEGTLVDRLASVAAATRTAKRTPPAASSAALGIVFRGLARLGVFGWFIGRQHLVHTFVTNVRGPDMAVAFLGAPVVEVVPVAVVTGNVTVSFAALSYAGVLTVTVIADPDCCPDLDHLVAALGRQLDAIAALGPIR